MFIMLTHNNNTVFINANYIEGIKPLADYTQIWLVDGDIIRVKEPASEIFKLIEEARNYGNQA